MRVPKSGLIGHALTRFIFREDQDLYYLPQESMSSKRANGRSSSSE